MKQSKQTNLNHPEPINPGIEPTNHNNKEVSSCYRAISNKGPKGPKHTVSHFTEEMAPTTKNVPAPDISGPKTIVTIPIPIKIIKGTELPLLSLSAS